MKYITYLFLIVVFAMTVSAPRVFAVSTNFDSTFAHVSSGTDFLWDVNPTPTYLPIGGNVYTEIGTINGGNSESACSGLNNVYSGIGTGFSFSVPSAGVGYYYLSMWDTDSGALCSGNQYGYVLYYYDGSQFYIGPSFSDLSTRIISVTPIDNATTTVGYKSYALEVYINADDYTSQDSSIWSINDSYSWGVSSIAPDTIMNATSTTLSSGYNYSTLYLPENFATGTLSNYFSLVQDYDCGIFGWFGCQKVWDDLRTTNYLGLNEIPFGAWDTNNTNEFIAGLASTTQSASVACNPLGFGFSMSLCVIGLLYPPVDVMANNIRQMKEIAPWGYAFRFYDILSGTATTSTTTLPSIHYTYSTTSAMYSAGLTELDFDPFGEMSATSSLFLTVKSDQEVPKTLWEIVAPLFHIMFSIALGFLILSKLFNIDLHSSGVSSRGALGDTNSGDDSYRLKEYLYKNRKR